MQTAYFLGFQTQRMGADPTGVALHALELPETPCFHRGKILHGVALKGNAVKDLDGQFFVGRI